jgi:tryptophan 2,3-dioxygenase
MEDRQGDDLPAGGGCPFLNSRISGLPSSLRGSSLSTSHGPYPKAKEPVYYSDYLQLDQLLSCQRPKSEDVGKPAHDEMLFIITHQAYELWFKQILHELDLVLALFSQNPIPEGDVWRINHYLDRIVKIQKLLVEQISIIETMSPLDFLDFRDLLLPASGFQSFQFRLIENKLGMLPENRLRYQYAAYHTRLSSAHQELVQNSEKGPTLFESVEAWLERIPFLQEEETGFKFWDEYKVAADKMFNEEKDYLVQNAKDEPELLQKQMSAWQQNRDFFLSLLDESKHEEIRAKGLRRLSFRATQAALLITLYRDEPILSGPFKLLTLLVDMDNAMQHWRHRHSMMVHRMIGNKMGTGGSSGYSYLKSTLQRGRIFADISNLSTYLLPRYALPELPPSLQRMMHYLIEAEKVGMKAGKKDQKENSREKEKEKEKQDEKEKEKEKEKGN